MSRKLDFYAKIIQTRYWITQETNLLKYLSANAGSERPTSCDKLQVDLLIVE